MNEKPIVVEINVGENTETSREMNDLEFAQYTATQNKIAEIEAQKEQMAIDKAALLIKLGITEAEAKLLLS